MVKFWIPGGTLKGVILGKIKRGIKVEPGGYLCGCENVATKRGGGGVLRQICLREEQGVLLCGFWERFSY